MFVSFFFFLNTSKNLRMNFRLDGVILTYLLYTLAVQLMTKTRECRELLTVNVPPKKALKDINLGTTFPPSSPPFYQKECYCKMDNSWHPYGLWISTQYSSPGMSNQLRLDARMFMSEQLKILFVGLKALKYECVPSCLLACFEGSKK